MTFAQAPGLPALDPNAALAQAAQQGSVVWFAAFVLIFFGTITVLGGYFVVYPWAKKSMELMDQTGQTLTVVTESQERQMRMMQDINVVGRDTSDRVELITRKLTVFRDIVAKVAKVTNVNIDAELGRLTEIIDQAMAVNGSANHRSM